MSQSISVLWLRYRYRSHWGWMIVSFKIAKLLFGVFLAENWMEWFGMLSLGDVENMERQQED